MLINTKGLFSNAHNSKKDCDILHVAKLDNGKESVFLIQDIFPITERYIVRNYTIAGNHLQITNENLAIIIEKKARRVMGMIRRGIKFTPTQPDVLQIEKKLINCSNSLNWDTLEETNQEVYSR